MRTRTRTQTLNRNFQHMGLWAALLVITIPFASCDQWNDHQAKVTTTRMRVIGQLLLKEQPADPDDAYMDELVVRHPGLDSRLDAWGSAIEVEGQESVRGRRVYRIRSRGRDGVVGNCCQKFVTGDWDQDAVLLAKGEELTWLQVW